MTDLVKIIKQIIKEEKTSKNGILLEAPEGTRNMRKKPVDRDKSTVIDPNLYKTGSGSETNSDDDSDVFTNTPPEDSPQSASNRDFRPGFNLYHGVVVEVFSQLHQQEGPTNDIIRKVTEWALQQLNNGDTAGVFQGSSGVSPQQLAMVIQKSMQVIVNHIAKEAEREAIENDIFNVADM